MLVYTNGLRIVGGSARGSRVGSQARTRSATGWPRAIEEAIKYQVGLVVIPDRLPAALNSLMSARSQLVSRLAKTCTSADRLIRLFNYHPHHSDHRLDRYLWPAGCLSSHSSSFWPCCSFNDCTLHHGSLTRPRCFVNHHQLFRTGKVGPRYRSQDVKTCPSQASSNRVNERQW